MKEYLATFASTHRALKAEKVLKEANIPSRLIPTPQKLAVHCELSIAFGENERTAVANALKGSGIKTVAVYRKEGAGYVKM